MEQDRIPTFAEQMTPGRQHGVLRVRENPTHPTHRCRVGDEQCFNYIDGVQPECVFVKALKEEPGIDTPDTTMKAGMRSVIEFHKYARRIQEGRIWDGCGPFEWNDPEGKVTIDPPPQSPHS